MIAAQAACGPVIEGTRQVWLIARDDQGVEIDSLEVTGPLAGYAHSGVDMGDQELRAMYFAQRSFEDSDAIGYDGAIPGSGQIGVRQFTMRLITQATFRQSWNATENRLWNITNPDVGYGRTGRFAIRFKERTGEAREIEVRRTGTPEPSNDTYAGQRGWEAWTFEVTALDPWWYGPDEVARFENVDAATSTTLHIDNPGDRPGDLIWTIPASTRSQWWVLPDGLGVYPSHHSKAGQRIMIPLPMIESGDIARVDTRGHRLPFQLLGKPMSFGLVKQARWTNPLPPRTVNAALPITMDTATDAMIEARIHTAYERPYS